jgi:hypothetical protein
VSPKAVPTLAALGDHQKKKRSMRNWRCWGADREGMISRSGTIPVSYQPPSVGGPDHETTGTSAKPATNSGAALSAERSPGTSVLVSALTPDRSGLWARAAEANAAAAPKPGESPAAALERTIRSNPAYQALSKGDRQVAEWIIWKAGMAEPQQRLYYLNKLELLLNTPFDARPGSPGAKSFADRINTEVDESLAQERARGDVFKGQEELRSAEAVLSTHQGLGGTIFRIDARDPRNVVLKIKIQLNGEPELIAKIKEFEDSIEKRASVRGYVVDVEFVDKGGPDVFSVKASSGEWPTAGNLAGGANTLAHEIHHLLGLSDRYDYIESHAGNKDMAVNQRLYWFAVQMPKPADPRYFASWMADPDKGTLLSEDICAVIQGPQKECIDARKEFDPPDLPSHPPWSVH